ncbi:MAG: galactokinase [Phycisphaerales bacterium]
MIADSARELFREHFHAEPSAVAVAPGRVNLIGEHVDYAEGFVLPIAIDRATAVAARLAASQSASTFVSRGVGIFTIDLTRPFEPVRGDASWANYVLGPLRELMDFGHRIGNVELAIASDVPLGGGLSSSAALEVAVTVATLALLGASMDGLALARLCQRAEHRFPGTPCGIMDMTASANARAGHALLLDCRSLAIEHVPLPSGVEVLIVDSGVRHRLSDGGYAARRSAVEEAARRLGVRTLRDATTATVEAAGFEPELLRRARHVTSEIARTIDAAAALRGGDAPAFGRLMTLSHASLRDDFGVSVPELDAIVDALLSAPGVFGARLTGGGFGGSAIALVEGGLAAKAGAIASAAFARRFGRAPVSFVTSAAAGAALVP